MPRHGTTGYRGDAFAPPRAYSLPARRRNGLECREHGNNHRQSAKHDRRRRRAHCLHGICRHVDPSGYRRTFTCHCYARRLIQKAIVKARELPAEDQDTVAVAVLSMSTLRYIDERSPRGATLKRGIQKTIRDDRRIPGERSACRRARDARAAGRPPSVPDLLEHRSWGSVDSARSRCTAPAVDGGPIGKTNGEMRIALDGANHAAGGAASFFGRPQRRWPAGRQRAANMVLLARMARMAMATACGSRFAVR
jgi:hypothetical protein